MMFYRWKFKRAAVSAGMAARSGGPTKTELAANERESTRIRKSEVRNIEEKGNPMNHKYSGLKSILIMAVSIVISFIGLAMLVSVVSTLF